MAFVNRSLCALAQTALVVALSSSSGFVLAQDLTDTLSDGIEQREKGNINRSIDIFKAGLKNDPENLRMKIELASSYFVNQNYILAKNLAEEVLANDSLPAVVRKNINSFVENIDNVQNKDTNNPFRRRHTFNFFTGYDSNANIAPNDTLLDIGELSEDSIERSEYFNAYLYDFSQYKPVMLNTTVGNRSRSLYHYNGITFYNKNYNGFDSSDILSVSARAGMKYALSSNWYVKAKVSATYVNLDDRSLFNYLNLSAQAGYRIENSEIAIEFAGKANDNFQERHDGRKGYYSSQGLIYTYHFSSSMYFNLLATNLDVNLKDDSYSYDSSEFEAIFHAALWENVNVNLSTSYTDNDYRSPQQYYSDARKDEVYRHNLKLDFIDVYKDFDLQFSYTYIGRLSNHDINVYDRNEIMFTVKFPLGG